MSVAVRVLFVEDNPDDVELILMALTQAGYVAEWQQVSDRVSMSVALTRNVWDVVLCDYSMPQFDALGALQVMRSLNLDVPFIIVSGTIGDDSAVHAMKAGAHDFFAKNALKRLPAAISREIAEARLRVDRRRALQALHDSEVRSKLILEHASDYAILMLDPSGLVASWNDGAERVFGSSSADALGAPLAPMLPAELPPPSPTVAVSCEGWCLHRSGRTFWAEVSISPIAEHGVFCGWAVIVRDISDRKHLLDELRRAVQSRDDFLSIASHELKTPLTALTLQVQMGLRAFGNLSDEDVHVSKLQQRMQVIETHARRMGLLIERLLDITQIHAGQLTLQRRAVDLACSVREVVERMQDDAKAAGVTIRMGASTPVIGHWDGFRIDTIVTNLLTNALKYGNNKPVDVDVAIHEAKATIRVSDHGMGIAEKDRERVFERFERAVTRHNSSGFGIGLWLVRQLAQAHGGSVYVEGQPGGGSVFTVELPLN